MPPGICSRRIWSAPLGLWLREDPQSWRSSGRPSVTIWQHCAMWKGLLSLVATTTLSPSFCFFCLHYCMILVVSSSCTLAEAALSLPLFANAESKVLVGGKWDLSRQAMRICTGQGYHLKPMFPTDPEIEQMYRRTFWCAYISDRHSSCNLGRPITIPDSDITVDVCY